MILEKVLKIEFFYFEIKEENFSKTCLKADLNEE